MAGNVERAAQLINKIYALEIPNPGMVAAQALQDQGLLQARDASWKYIAQMATADCASRHGHAWEEWEDEYLLSDSLTEGLAQKAVALGRSYRAVESRRCDLIRRARVIASS